MENWDLQKELFLSGDFSDCEILVESKNLAPVRFPCHKSILSVASEVFASVLTSKECIEIRNATPSVIDTVLEFIYFGNVQLGDWNFVCDLLHAAYEYKILKLISTCQNFLSEGVTSRNACYILEAAITCNTERLKEDCLAFCRSAGFVILSTKSFREVSLQTVQTILSIPDLQVQNEMMVYRAVWEWARYRCCIEQKLLSEENIASEINPLLEFVGFEFMSEEEIQSIPTCVLEKFRQNFPDEKLECKNENKNVMILPLHQPSVWRQKLFLSEKFCDCVIIAKRFESCARFPCHRIILSTASDVFSQMFQNDSQDGGRNLTMEDVSPSTMLSVLKYIYLNEVELEGWKFTCELLTAACKYQLPALILQCMEYLEGHVRAINTCFLFEVATLDKLQNWKDFCGNFSWFNKLSKMIESKGFFEICQEWMSLSLAGINRIETKWDFRKELFLSDDYSDCEISLENDNSPGARFPCHKPILSAASETFASVLTSKGQIEVRNCSARIIETVLRFVYFGTLEIKDINYTSDVFRIAFEFKISKLIHICEEYLLKEMTSWNVCHLFEVGISMNSEKLKEKCLALCKICGFEVLSMAAFREASLETVRAILSTLDVQVVNRLVVFKAVLEWARYRCCKEFKLLSEENIAIEMSPLFEFIGFEYMSQEEITCIPDCFLKRFRQLFLDIIPGCNHKNGPNASILPKHESSDIGQKLFLSENSSDCVIIAKTPESCARFPCHRIILGAASDVLAQMFEDGPQDGGNIFTVEDTCPSTMFALLKYIYVNQVELQEWKIVCKVLTAARKFKLPDLIMICTEYLKQNVTSENIGFLFAAATSNEFQNLKDVCGKFIWCRELFQPREWEEFLEMDQDLIIHIFSLFNDKRYNNFILCNITNKASFFDCVWKWASFSCCKSKALGKREKVWNYISPLMEFFHFDKMSDLELECIPQTALGIISLDKTNLKSSNNDEPALKDSSSTFSRRNKRPKMNFPLQLPKLRRSFEICWNYLYGNFKFNGCLLKFSLNRNAYLVGFLARSQKEQYIFRSLFIRSRSGTLAALGTQGKHNLEIQYNSSDNMTFNATDLIFLQAHEEYSIEVNCGKVEFELNRDSLRCKKDRDMEISILTEYCYGVTYMKFIPAS